MLESEITADQSQPHLHECHKDHAHEHQTPKERQEHDERKTIVSMDTLGIFASTLCLIHCFGMSLLVGLLPAFGLQFLEGHLAHVALASFVVAFGIFAVVPGYLKHRRTDVLTFMVLGLLFVLFATFGAGSTFGESWELPLITAGNLILVGTHLRNRALCRCAGHVH